jgi:AbrB family looped-hinge helix DNA binding protein
MIIKRELGEKGQVVIPKDIRDFLNLKIKGNIIFEIRDNEVILKPEDDPEKIINDYCNVPGKKIRTSPSEIRKIIMEKYKDEVSRY